jgi:hypothetical protein
MTHRQKARLVGFLIVIVIPALIGATLGQLYPVQLRIEIVRLK